MDASFDRLDPARPVLLLKKAERPKDQPQARPTATTRLFA